MPRHTQEPVRVGMSNTTRCTSKENEKKRLSKASPPYDFQNSGQRKDPEAADRPPTPPFSFYRGEPQRFCTSCANCAGMQMAPPTQGLCTLLREPRPFISTAGESVTHAHALAYHIVLCFPCGVLSNYKKRVNMGRFSGIASINKHVPIREERAGLCPDFSRPMA